MAVTRETLRLLKAIGLRTDETIAHVVRELVAAWSDAWDLVVDDWELAIIDLQQAAGDKRWPSRKTVLQAKRALAALEATADGLRALADQAGVTISAAVPDAVEAAAGHLDVIASQLPKTANGAELAASLVRADAEAISAIVVRTQEQVTKLAPPSADAAFETIQRRLIRGVAQGLNPRKAAARLLADLRSAFNGSLSRALTIASTEILDAHRTAAAVHHRANAGVLAGWQWLSALDRRTCPSCWAMHGREFPLDEPGPHDHQQGRCARLPITKSWHQLGFDYLDEPPSLVADSRVKFDKLTPALQRKIMGPARLKALQDGTVAWSDLSTLRKSDRWRDSHTTAPLKSFGVTPAKSVAES